MRGVREGLVVDLRQRGNDGSRLFRPNIEFCVVRSEVCRDGLGVVGLVVGGLGETDRERAHGPAARLLHQRNDTRGVDAAREKGPQRDVRDHAGANGVAQMLFQGVNGGFRALGPWVCQPGAGGLCGRPVGGGLGHGDGFCIVDGDAQPGAGKQFPAMAIDGERCGDRAVTQEQGDVVAIDLCGEGRIGPQGSDLGCEQERVARPGVVERFLSEPVACEQQAAFEGIPYGKREHSVRALQGTLEAPVFDGCKQDLGVGLASEPGTRCRQFVAQCREVVDLTIVGDDVATAGGLHRLASCRGKIDDGEAAVAERHLGPFVMPSPAVVGAAVAQDVCRCHHPARDVARRGCAGGCEISCDAAHVRRREPLPRDASRRSTFRARCRNARTQS